MPTVNPRASAAVIVERERLVRIVPRELTTEVVDAAEQYRTAELRASSPTPAAASTPLSRLKIENARRERVQARWDDLVDLVSIDFTDRDDATAFVLSLAAAIDHVWPTDLS